MLRYASAAALVLALWMVLFAAIPSEQPAVGDEVNWLAAGDVTYRLVRDLEGPAVWEKANAGLYSFGRLNPPIGKLAFGTALAQVKLGDGPVHYWWRWTFSPARNLRPGNRVPPAHAQAGRVAVSLFSALSLALLVALAHQVTGAFWLSLAGPALLVSFAAFELSATRIYTDAPQIAFMLGAMVAFQHHLRGRSWGSLVAAGVMMGLSVAVKYSSAPVVAVMGLFTLFAAGTLAQRVARGALIGLIPVAVFIAVNPFLYPDPLGRTLEIASDWAARMDRMSALPYWANTRVASPWEGLAIVARRGMLAPAQSIPSRAAAPWLALAALLAFVGVALRCHIRPGSRLQTLETRMGLGLAALGLAGFGLGAFGAWAWLYLLGANWLGWRVATGRDDPRRMVAAFFVVSLLVIWLATGLWLKLDLSRYALRVLVLAPCVYVSGLVALTGLFEWERRPPRNVSA